jgi:hypothetical protein
MEQAAGGMVERQVLLWRVYSKRAVFRHVLGTRVYEEIWIEAVFPF